MAKARALPRFRCAERFEGTLYSHDTRADSL